MPRMLREALKQLLDQDELEEVCSAFDTIGGIIIIKIPESLNQKKRLIAEVLLQKVNNVYSVFCQTSGVQGDYRLRNLEFLAGINSPITYYKENGCTFKIDVVNAYFSPRLSTERMRIANLVKDNEVIVNLFGGVGTYSVLIARGNKTAKVYSIDSNIFAHELCIENSTINKVNDRVISLFGDAKVVVNNQLKEKATRVLMPLPEKAREFVEEAVSSLINGAGTVHFFAHVKADSKKDAIDKGAAETNDAFKGYKISIEGVRVVREVGPRLYQIVSDVRVISSMK
jgi:tRNA (guanine37-N1)-methyltransferase